MNSYCLTPAGADSVTKMDTARQNVQPNPVRATESHHRPQIPATWATKSNAFWIQWDHFYKSILWLNNTAQQFLQSLHCTLLNSGWVLEIIFRHETDSTSSPHFAGKHLLAMYSSSPYFTSFCLISGKSLWLMEIEVALCVDRRKVSSVQEGKVFFFPSLALASEWFKRLLDFSWNLKV